MRVKRYVVDSMPDALQRIRSDLGKDAVILNTKEVRSGGFLGLFTNKKIEVIAAIDSSDSNDSANIKSKTRSDQVTHKSNHNKGPAAQIAAASQAAPIAVLEKKIEEQSSSGINEEIKQIKKMMVTLMNQGTEKNKASIIFENIEKQLIEHEFDPIFIQEIFNRILEEANDRTEEWSEKDVYRLVKAQLQSMVPADQIYGIGEGTKLVHFVGPTGVGKTTTIAKLAAEQVLNHHKKVGFITSDTYRIAAVEQLRTYATILNVPLEVVYSPQDLTKAIDVLKDRDIIFMDTAGRNFRNEMYVSELNSLLKAHENSETFLVLSLTMKYKDMKAVTHNFSKFNLDKILFTKKDETVSLGSIFNIVHDFSLKLSYIANGQNVPDDIAKINVDELIDQILEDSRDE